MTSCSPPYCTTPAVSSRAVLDFTALERARLFAAEPASVDPHEVDFYHAINVPGFGEFTGAWDLRSELRPYLGRVDYQDASVLDLGTSDGFLAFEMEKRGATVVTVDLPCGMLPDLFPLSPPPHTDPRDRVLARLGTRRRAFWLCHRALASHVRLHEGHVARLDGRLAGFDVALMGNVLQHLRDPVGVLLDLASRAETLVVTEADWLNGTHDDAPLMELFTAHLAKGNPGSWFMLSPRLVEDLLSLAGFSILGRDTHHQQYSDPTTHTTYPVRHYTITAKRTASLTG
jgi:hypothetical protein